MSKMSALDLLIRTRLERGQEPADIARDLDIPLSWVYEIEEQEDLSPYATINS